MRVRARRWAVVGLAAVSVLSGCSGGDEKAGPAPTTTTVGSGGAFAPSGGCPMIPPGQLMSAAEATIRFSVDRVCPGYVTIAPGTTVEVRNESAESATVTVRRGLEASGDVVFERKLPPGGQTTVTLEEPGFHLYTVDLLESFKGTIEVLSP